MNLSKWLASAACTVAVFAQADTRSINYQQVFSCVSQDNMCAVIKDDPESAFDTLYAQRNSRDAMVQFRLAGLYEYGLGTSKSPRLAISHFERAEQAGAHQARYRLTPLYRTFGDKHAQEGDFKSAVPYYLKAAERGDALAQYKLADHYSRGQGVTQSIEKAVRWFDKAAALGHFDAYVRAIHLYADHNIMPPAWQEHESVVNLKKAANRGDIKSHRALATRYFIGHGVKRSPQKAKHHWQQAVIGGDLLSTYTLKKLSATSIKTRAQNGEAEALYDLAWVWQNSGLGEKAEKQAYHYYFQAATAGHINAQFHIADALEKGKGVTKNIKAAAKWFHQAALGEHAKAQYRLALLLWYGIGVKADAAAARHWMRQSAAQSYDVAGQFLSQM